MSADPPEAYYLDNYGHCALGAGKCECLRTQWLGTGCPNWVPLGAKSVQDLMEHVRTRLLKPINKPASSEREDA